MLTFPRRVALVGALLVFMPLPALATASSDTGEQTAIEQAIRAYESNREAAESKAKDQLVAAKTSALLNDPLTPVIGNPAADVVIIEFFDYACPFCKAVEPRLERLLKDDKRVKTSSSVGTLSPGRRQT